MEGDIIECFCPRTVTLDSWCWFSSFQLELARTKYFNRKREPIERFIVIQKILVKIEHCKIVLLKLNPVTESITRNIWKHSLIQMRLIW